MSLQRKTFFILFGFIAIVSLVALVTDDSAVVSARAGLGQKSAVAMESIHTPDDVHPLDPVLQLARDALVKLEREVDDYTADLRWQERVGGRLGEVKRARLKIRTTRSGVENNRSVAAYLKFTEPRSMRDREVIWVEGRNDNKLIVHEGGLKNLFRMNLDPTGRLAMMGSKYPATEIGLAKLLEKLIEKGERDRTLGYCEVKIYEDQSVADRKCRLVQVTHPEKKAGLEFHIAKIYLDTERLLPLRYVAYMWPDRPGNPPPLEEEYTYVNLKLNVGLGDRDFDPDNPEYNYP